MKTTTLQTQERLPRPLTLSAASQRALAALAAQSQELQEHLLAERDLVLELQSSVEEELHSLKGCVARATEAVANLSREMEEYDPGRNGRLLEFLIDATVLAESLATSSPSSAHDNAQRLTYLLKDCLRFGWGVTARVPEHFDPNLVHAQVALPATLDDEAPTLDCVLAPAFIRTRKDGTTVVLRPARAAVRGLIAQPLHQEEASHG